MNEPLVFIYIPVTNKYYEILERVGPYLEITPEIDNTKKIIQKLRNAINYSIE